MPGKPAHSQTRVCPHTRRKKISANFVATGTASEILPTLYNSARSRIEDQVLVLSVKLWIAFVEGIVFPLVLMTNTPGIVARQSFFVDALKRSNFRAADEQRNLLVGWFSGTNRWVVTRCGEVDEPSAIRVLLQSPTGVSLAEHLAH